MSERVTQTAVESMAATIEGRITQNAR